MTPVEPPASTLRTNPQLLFRLRDWKDCESWKEFYRLYYNFVYGYARKARLSHADAEEVTQDVFRRTAERIHEFESDPRRGKFRGWIMNQVRWRIADKFRAHHPHERHAPPRREPDDSRENTIDSLPDTHLQGTDWEADWQHHVLEAALHRLARRVPPKHFQAFDLYGKQGWPVLRVARELDLNPASVYLIHHRFTKMLKAEVHHLEERLQ